MDIPTPPQAVTALAGFVRDRLAEVGGALSPIRRREDVEILPPAGSRHEGAVVAAARQFATAVVGAAAPFAPTSDARARLLRQMHAAGLLTDDEFRRTTTIIDLDARSQD
jgi:hypothetical protein